MWELCKKTDLEKQNCWKSKEAAILKEIYCYFLNGQERIWELVVFFKANRSALQLLMDVKDDQTWQKLQHEEKWLYLEELGEEKTSRV